ncbi:MAG: hypothetical protein ACD_19C00182G0062 [uncultured bacterium]|nr:MAG: hypothetical protein ACD_19C00182G0062 [uncultured bacterium]
MLNKLLITNTTSLEEIRQAIGVLREQKGKEKETLKLIEEALVFGHGFVANLFFEEALTYQHLYMSDSSNKKALFDMEKSILKASFYVNKYKIVNLNSRLFRFMGKVADYKKQYKKAINYYRKAGKNLEIEGFISYSTIMSGQTTIGYKLAKSVYKKFLDSKEGKELQKNDYNAWAIWMSGIAIRTVNALIDIKVNFNKQEIESWIKDTEKYLMKNDSFSYRKMEIKELWTKLQNYKNT